MRRRRSTTRLNEIGSYLDACAPAYRPLAECRDLVWDGHQRALGVCDGTGTAGRLDTGGRRGSPARVRAWRWAGGGKSPDGLGTVRRLLPPMVRGI
jgi:hypothetical protein